MARLLRNLSFFRQSLLSQSIGVRNGLVGASTHICHFASKGKRKSSSDESDSGEENLSKKDLALKQALDQITKSFGKGSIMWLGRSVCPKQVPVVSTGSLALDIALGVGGLPKGRVIEIYGPEASGKTTLALHVIAEAQKQGGYCCFVDAEHALDPALAEAIGVNTGNLLVSQPDCGEQALGLVDTLIRSGSVDVVVVDSDCTATTTWLQPDSIAPQRSSRHVWEPLQCNHVVVAVQSFSSSQVKVAALVPKSELEGEMGDPHMAMQARLMSQALRKLSHSLSLSQTVLIFINQVRAKLSTFSGFGGPQEVTCGGNALKFYASVRLNIKRVGNVIKGEQTIGSQVAVKIVKNKLAPPFRTAEFELEFGKGICRESELIQLGLKHKFISKMGSAYYGMNNQTFHGKDALKQYLAKDISAREELIMKLREKLLHDVGNKDAAGTETVNGYPVEVVSTDTTDDEVVATAAEV